MVRDYLVDIFYFSINLISLLYIYNSNNDFLKSDAEIVQLFAQEISDSIYFNDFIHIMVDALKCMVRLATVQDLTNFDRVAVYQVLDFEQIFDFRKFCHISLGFH